MGGYVVTEAVSEAQNCKHEIRLGVRDEPEDRRCGFGREMGQY